MHDTRQPMLRRTIVLSEEVNESAITYSSCSENPGAMIYVPRSDQNYMHDRAVDLTRH